MPSNELDKYVREIYLSGVSEHRRREQVKTLLTTLLVPRETRRARQMSMAGPVKLHLGCGSTYLPDWVNVDLSRPGRHVDLQWDLRRGLPFPDGSASSIFSEHLFEHIPLPGVMALLSECRRVLRPGGTFRMVVPDFKRYAESYVGQGPLIESFRPNRPTQCIALSEVFFFYQHRMMYDASTAIYLLDNAGFANPAQTEFGVSNIIPCPDTETRRLESLYVEAYVPQT